MTDHTVVEFSKARSGEIAALFAVVWPTAEDYLESWRTRRMLSAEAIEQEMDSGYRYFGVDIDGRIAGVYKLYMTDDGAFGEQQSIHPDFMGRGLAKAMYAQFIAFAGEHGCRKNYINILDSQEQLKRYVEKIGFVKQGAPFEQIPGMLVQRYERTVDH